MIGRRYSCCPKVPFLRWSRAIELNMDDASTRQLKKRNHMAIMKNPRVGTTKHQFFTITITSVMSSSHQFAYIPPSENSGKPCTYSWARLGQAFHYTVSSPARSSFSSRSTCYVILYISGVRWSSGHRSRNRDDTVGGASNLGT